MSGWRDAISRLWRGGSARASAAEPRQPDDTAELLAQLSAHDAVTGEHVNHVACYATEIALICGVPTERLRAIDIGARLHDIGKIGIPEHLLSKAGALDTDEWAVMRRHPALGAELLQGYPALASAALTVRAHHERWDGTGYPDRLAGEAIPHDARIFAVADSIDAMHADRPYRAGQAWAVVQAELTRGAGAQWDPTICARVLEQFERIRAMDRGCPHGSASRDGAAR